MGKDNNTFTHQNNQQNHQNEQGEVNELNRKTLEYNQLHSNQDEDKKTEEIQEEQGAEYEKE